MKFTLGQINYDATINQIPWEELSDYQQEKWEIKARVVTESLTIKEIFILVWNKFTA